ncbi:helix-turn-helix family protein [Bordetella holmesii 41130]|nr:helix-turn-helix family protein [Bordetella holmesii 41130]
MDTPMAADPDPQDVNARIAQRVRALRAAGGLSLQALAERSGVSRSMISLIERGAASPTAVVLDRLAGGLGVPLAGLFEAGCQARGPLRRHGEQTVWRDPASGYERRALSPPGWPSPLQLVEVVFPPGARVAYETGLRRPALQQQIWMLAGSIDIALGEDRFALNAGDCLAMVLDQSIVFSNPRPEPARYLLATLDPLAP